MKETLIALLGTGQSVLKNIEDRNYRKVIYYDKSLDEAYETPFISEAIIKLNPKKFDNLILLGTNNSMWEVLYSYCCEDFELNDINNDDLTNFGKLSFEMENSKLNNLKDYNLIESNHSIFQKLENKLSEKFNITTKCFLIPLGDNQEELWDLMKILVNLDLKKSIVSFDITHGLRYQPFYLMTALQLMKFNDQITLGSFYYGALELQNQNNNKGMAPIIEFTIFGDMFEWINAANSFRNYYDYTLISTLLRKNEKFKLLADKLRDFGRAYQFGLYEKLNSHALRIIEELNKLKDQYHPAFELIKEIVRKLPQEIIDCEEDPIKIGIQITKHNLKIKNYAMAILNIFETFLRKIIIDSKSSKKSVNLSETCNHLLKNRANYNFLFLKANIKVDDFFKHLAKIHFYRNNIAHFDIENQIDKLDEIQSEIKNGINYFINLIEKEDLTYFSKEFAKIDPKSSFKTSKSPK